MSQNDHDLLKGVPGIGGAASSGIYEEMPPVGQRPSDLEKAAAAALPEEPRVTPRGEDADMEDAEGSSLL